VLLGVHEIDKAGEVPLEAATRLFGTIGTNVKRRGRIAEIIFDLALESQGISFLGEIVGDEREPIGRYVRDLDLKIVKRLGRRLGSGWRRGSRMGERAIFLDEFPRLAKSGDSLLFVSRWIDGNGDDLVETVSAQLRNILP
jgi:hypothetical protein